MPENMSENIGQQSEISPEAKKTEPKLTPEQVDAGESVINLLKHNDVASALEVIKEFTLPKEFIKSPLVQSYATRSLFDSIQRHRGEEFTSKIVDGFELSSELIHAAAEKFINNISWYPGDIYLIEYIIKMFGLSGDVVKAAAHEAAIRRLRDGDIDDFDYIRSKFAVLQNEDDINSEKVQSAAKKGLVDVLSNRDVSGMGQTIGTSFSFLNRFYFSKEVIQSAEVQSAAKIALTKCFYQKRDIYFDLASSLKKTFALSEEVTQSALIEGITKSFISEEFYKIKSFKNEKTFALSEEIIQVAAEESIVHHLKKDKIQFVFTIIKELSLPEWIVQKAAKEGAIYHLKVKDKKGIDSALQIIENFLPVEFLKSPEVQVAAKEGMIHRLTEGNIGYVLKIIEKFLLTKDFLESQEVLVAAEKGVICQFSQGNISSVIQIRERFALSEADIQSAAREGIIQSNHQIENSKIYTFFSEEIKINCGKYNLLIKEYFLNEDRINNADFGKLSKEEQSKEIFKNLKNTDRRWQDEENISGPFEEGGEYFGYDKMWQYIGLGNRHDTLYNFAKIVALAAQSGLKPNQFFGQILNQVKFDSSDYDGEKSYQYLNRLVNAVDIGKAEEVFDKARHYPEINKLQTLIAELENKENIFKSWDYFKKYYELTQLVNKTELLDKLIKIKKENPKLYNYAETLMFHPGISMNEVVQFVENPNQFLDISDDHSVELHQLKKPSNYIEIPFLDLDAKNLRDGLVEGALDKIQAWSPLEITYKLNQDLLKKADIRGESSEVDVRQLLSIVFNINKDEKQKLDIRDVKQLRKKLTDLFVGYKNEIRLQNYIKEPKIDLPSGLTERQILDILFDEKVGISKNAEEKPSVILEFRAKLNLKSDPDAVVAGDDTACCMPFGSGKNNVYTFNPICSLFTLQQKRNGVWRTVAQSVMTKNIDLKKNIGELMSQMGNTEIKSHLHNIISEEILTNNKTIMTADNVEVAENFKNNPNHNQIIEIIYQDFFKEYAKKYADQQNISTDQIIIGPGNSDALGQLPKIDNTFVPEAPVAYSDNMSDNTLALSLKGHETSKFILEKVIKDIHKPEINHDLILDNLGKGISYLSYKDCIKAAYIEGKAYEDNPSLMEYLHNMENGLIAKDINNAYKNRPNLSLAYTDEKNKMQGYLFAYQGKENDEEIIYIADLAANPEAKLAGGRLINGFLALYNKFYLEKGNLMPIVARAREKTSYQIIKKQLDKIGQKLNITFRLVESEGEESSEQDVMHYVKIIPEKLG